jgi:heparan-alpha-glucosaminide N-acetyltransferase
MSTSPDTATSPLAHQRLTSIDAYRGFVMFLMMAEVLRLSAVARAVPNSRVWQWLAWHQTHVEWAGCTLHDLIQPSFSFLVGVALPFSLAARLAKGQPRWVMALHALWRAFLLCALGIFLRSMGDDKHQTNFTFEDTLTQIGLGYFFLFLLGLTRPRWHWAALVVLLVGYWGAFAVYQVPASESFYSQATVGVPANWEHHYPLDSFEAHWNKNSNAAWAFDRWFLNLFPRAKEFLFNGGGYTTLCFIPTLATMILGLIAGAWIRRATTAPAALASLPHGDVLEPRRAIVWMLLAAAGCFAIALLVDALGLCPIVKRIWTPTWTLFSGGWCFVFMAGLFALIDVAKVKAWPFPLVVIGANSIAAYVIAHVMEHFTIHSFHTHLGVGPFRVFGEAYQPLLEGMAVLLVYWLILLWMYRRRLFLKI